MRSFGLLPSTYPPATIPKSLRSLQALLLLPATMKTFAVALLVASASAFTPSVSVRSATTALNMVDLANGAMSFDRVCREWRCKYEGDKGTSKSLEAIAKVVDEYLPEIKKASKGATVNRLVCGACLDFKVRRYFLTIIRFTVRMMNVTNLNYVIHPLTFFTWRLAHDNCATGRLRRLGGSGVSARSRVFGKD